MKAPRQFAALVAPYGVWLVEFRLERDGYRVVGEWMDRTHNASLGAALDHLLAIIAQRVAGRSRLSLVLDQFGTFHHTLALPAATDEVLRPIIKREVQRAFGVADAAVAYTSEAGVERRDPPRGDARAAPAQFCIVGATRETISVLQTQLSQQPLDVRIVTTIPAALRRLHESLPDADQPSAVLAALDGGPHLAYFLDRKLELVVDPPIAVEGEQPSVDVVIDRVERGNVYLRQQFRGAAVSRVLLAARADAYEQLSKALHNQLALRIQPFVQSGGSPEAIIAMGAVLEADADAPLDLFPRQPTRLDRMRQAAAGAGALVAAAVTITLLVAVWSALQFAQLSRARSELARSNAALQADIPRIEPLRAVAERRADFAADAAFIRTTDAERAALTASLAEVANSLPPSARADSLRISRTSAGWSAALVGSVTGATTAEAVRALDTLYETLRERPGIASAALDEFTYANERLRSDSTAAAPDTRQLDSARPIVIRYRISFTLRGGERS